MKPLDLILFKGKDVFSKAVGVAEKLYLGNGDWTHVGVVINSEILPQIRNARPEKLYLFESVITTSSNHDIEINDHVLGVQIRDLAAVIEENDYEAIGVAELKDNPFIRKETDTDDIYNVRLSYIKSVMADIYEKYNKRLYDCNLFNLLAAIFPCFRPMRSNICCGKHLVFCSELVCIIYKELGMIPKKINEEDVTPMDFLGYDKDGLEPIHHLPPKIISGGIVN